MKEFNKELSRKLEAQTQRLELLTAQNMANDNISARQPDSHTIQENTAYADEGDEVLSLSLSQIHKCTYTHNQVHTQSHTCSRNLRNMIVPPSSYHYLDLSGPMWFWTMLPFLNRS